MIVICRFCTILVVMETKLCVRSIFVNRVKIIFITCQRSITKTFKLKKNDQIEFILQKVPLGINNEYNQDLFGQP